MTFTVFTILVEHISGNITWILEEMGFLTAGISLGMEDSYQKCFTEVHNESKKMRQEALLSP